MDSLNLIAGCYRQRAGLQAGTSAVQAVDALLELFPELELLPYDIRGAMLLSVETGGHCLIYEQRLKGWERARVLGHELAHLILIEEGWALPRPGLNGGNQDRLVRHWDGKEEFRCERLLALLLGETGELELEEAAEAIGCPLGWLVSARQRWQQSF